jgi:hypothetical protein
MKRLREWCEKIVDGRERKAEKLHQEAFVV